MIILRQFIATLSRLGCVLLAWLILQIPVHAQSTDPDEWGAEWRDESRSSFAPPPGRNDMSAEQATTLVRQQTGGRVLSATPVEGGYRVRVLVDGGRVTTLHVTNGGRIQKK